MKQTLIWVLTVGLVNRIAMHWIANIYEPPHDKTNKVTVRPAKTQISLGIRPVWSESSLCAQWVAKGPSFLHADSEDSDQTGRMPRLIWVFAGCTLTLLVLSRDGSYDKHAYYTDHTEFSQPRWFKSSKKKNCSSSPSECGTPPIISYTDIYGNRRTVGSKVQYKCTTDTVTAHTSVCLDTGTWSPVPACPIGKSNKPQNKTKT